MKNHTSYKPYRVLCTDLCPYRVFCTDLSHPTRTFPPTKNNSRRPVSESCHPVSGNLYSVTSQHSLQLFKLPSPVENHRAVYKKIEQPLTFFSRQRPSRPNKTGDQQGLSELHTSNNFFLPQLINLPSPSTKALIQSRHALHRRLHWALVRWSFQHH